MKATENLSAVSLSVIWNSFLSIAEEMGSTLRRTAFSEAVREGEDFSTGVFDRRGLLVAQGNFTPGHLGAMPYVVKSVMAIFPDGTLHPGDAVFLNDSKLGSGHFPDCFLVSPVFDESELIGYVVTTAHHVDVGGAAPGSQKVQGVTEAFQEGLRILPIRLMRQNEIDEDLLRMITANVRLPELVKGDILAQRNANFIGVQRLIKLFRTFGKRETELAIDNILDRSEKHTHELIRKIPEGTYSFTDYVEDCGLEDQSVTVAVDVTVRDGRVKLDFSRSSDFGSGRDQLLHQLHARLCAVCDQGVFGCAAAAERWHDPAGRGGGARRQFLQSALSGGERRARGDPGAHFRGHQRRARTGDAGTGGRSLYPLGQPQYRWHR